MTTIDRPGVYDGISDATYHGDPVPGGSLSSSGARTLLKSPALYQWERTHRVEKDVYDVGHAVHAKVLGTGADVVLLDFDSWRTKDARAAKAAAYAAGKTPMLTKDYGPVEAMAEAVLAHPLAKALLEKPGKPEQSLFAQDPTTGVWLRARIDYLHDPTEGRRTIGVDLKTAVSADPRRFRKAVVDHGYDVQDAFYQHVLRLARGDEDTAFVFIAVEKEPPHLVSVIELVGEFTDTGERQMRRAIETYKRCTETGEWPGYAPVVHPIDPPRWHVIAIEEEELAS